MLSAARCLMCILAIALVSRTHATRVLSGDQPNSSKAEEDGAGAGANCTGYLFYKQGTCAAGMYCYEECRGQVSLGSMCSGDKAEWSGNGKCFRPRSKSCLTNNECRPGTICLSPTCSDDSLCPASASLALECESCPDGTNQHVQCITTAIREAGHRLEWVNWHEDPQTKATRWRLIGKTLDEAYGAINGEHHLRTELDVPSVLQRFGSPELVRLALESSHAIKSAAKGSSRSGAVFFQTSDKLFFIKGFTRRSEYMVLSSFGWGAQTAPNGTVMPGPSSTTLNLPSLAFPAFGETYWTVSPNLGAAFLPHLGRQPKSFVSYDIKPFPLVSKHRQTFMGFLAGIGLVVSPSQHLQKFLEVLEGDLRALDARSLVDYSWMAYVYDMGPAVIAPAMEDYERWTADGESEEQSKKNTEASITVPSFDARRSDLKEQHLESASLHNISDNKITDEDLEYEHDDEEGKLPTLNAVDDNREGQSQLELAGGSSNWCFEASVRLNTGRRWIICLSLIDFTLAYMPSRSTSQSVENAVMNSKWTDYGGKFRQLTSCLLNLAPDQDSLVKELHLLPLPEMRFESSKKSGVKLSIRVSYDEKKPACSGCYTYRRLACKGLLADRWWSKLTESPSIGKRRTCRFSLAQGNLPNIEALHDKARYCFAFFVESCRRDSIVCWRKPQTTTFDLAATAPVIQSFIQAADDNF